MTKTPKRQLGLVLLHLGDGLRQVEDPAGVFYLEARDEDTTRPMRELLPSFELHGFLQIHREYAVNLQRVRQVRRRENSRDWEVKLAPPVNRVLPVSRSALRKLWEAFETGQVTD
jgi:DNA-binding LytR/AlgR family response regulator